MAKTIYGKLMRGLESFCKVALVIQTISVSIVVLGRQIFHKMPAWGEELTLLLLVWMSLVGAVILLKEDGHIALTSFDRLLPKKFIELTDLLSNSFLGFYAVVMLIHGLSLVEITAMSILPGLRIRTSWLYASVPVSSLLLLLVVVEKIINWFSHQEKEV
ncbi:MAG: TRAP transporter small permease subunit [Firmicutes bacterium]|nr:TRAP transporter small permease subunit [Bacillota bacterium]